MSEPAQIDPICCITNSGVHTLWPQNGLDRNSYTGIEWAATLSL